MFKFTKNTLTAPAVELGEKYRDEIHGIEGIATCYAQHLTGCDRVCLVMSRACKT